MVMVVTVTGMHEPFQELPERGIACHALHGGRICFLAEPLQPGTDLVDYLIAIRYS